MGISIFKVKRLYMETVYDFCVLDKKGNQVNLSQYKGNVLLIVNTATVLGSMITRREASYA